MGELIETLWNVNKIITAIVSVFTGINRNIVECKLVILTTPCGHFDELIETLRNVNAVTRDIKIDAVSELIETLWNVN